jgi:hypothetical protein
LTLNPDVSLLTEVMEIQTEDRVAGPAEATVADDLVDQAEVRDEVAVDFAIEDLDGVAVIIGQDRGRAPLRGMHQDRVPTHRADPGGNLIRGPGLDHPRDAESCNLDTRIAEDFQAGDGHEVLVAIAPALRDVIIIAIGCDAPIMLCERHELKALPLEGCAERSQWNLRVMGELAVAMDDASDCPECP